MKCNQCGKTIAATNTHTVTCDGLQMLVCGKHYSQFVKYGKFLDESPKSTHDGNEYEVVGDSVWVYCFNRKCEPSGKFVIDLADLKKVAKHKWRYWKGRFYTGNTKPISITSFLMNTPAGLVVDHIDNDPSNNRRCNLRVTIQQKNLLNKSLSTKNTSGIQGVRWNEKRKAWEVEIRMNYTRCHLSRWKELADAVYARYYAETLLFKEFRSKSNDEKILEYIIDCNQKPLIEKYVEEKLHKAFKNL